MPCPECAQVEREYLIFRKAFIRFAQTLDDLERDRCRLKRERDSYERPPIFPFKAILLVEDAERDGAQAD